METIYLKINWILYGLLFGAFFVKFTDNKVRKFSRKIAYGSLMIYCLFFSVMLFKSAYIFEPEDVVIKIGIYQTTFNLLILAFMITKVVDDEIFIKYYNKYTKKKYGKTN